MAQLAERAGVDLISVGDSVGKNLWGHASENEVTVAADGGVVSIPYADVKRSNLLEG